jgi:hypothetical protein
MSLSVEALRVDSVSLVLASFLGPRLPQPSQLSQGGDSDDPDHHSDLMPISLPEEADQVVRSEATLGF